MKKTAVLSVLLIGLLTTVFAQKEENEKKLKAANVPAAVTSAFAKQFPNAEAKWEKEGDSYEGEFEQNGKGLTVVFNATGTLLETEREIETAELPANVAKYIAEHHKGAKIKEAAKITDAKGTVTYEAEINGKDLLFDANGIFIR